MSDNFNQVTRAICWYCRPPPKKRFLTCGGSFVGARSVGMGQEISHGREMCTALLYIVCQLCRPKNVDGDILTTITKIEWFYEVACRARLENFAGCGWPLLGEELAASFWSEPVVPKRSGFRIMGPSVVTGKLLPSCRTTQLRPIGRLHSAPVQSNHMIVLGRLAVIRPMTNESANAAPSWEQRTLL